MNSNSLRILRRRFLGACGGLLGGFLGRLDREARAAEAGPRRLVIINTSNGTVQAKFWPARTSDTAFALSPLLQPLAPVKDQLLVLQGIDQKSALADAPVGEAHYLGVVHMLTGRVHTSKGAGGPSLDQYLAERVMFPTPNRSLALGVQSRGFISVLYSSMLDQYGRQAAVRDEIDPYQTFSRLFSGARPVAGTTRPPQMDVRKSILDFAAQDLGVLRRELRGAERAALDAHLQALRDAELAIKQPTAVAATEACGKAGAFAGGVDVQREASFPTVCKMQLDLVAAVLACDLARVITLNIGSPKSLTHYSWLGIGDEFHALSHGKSPDFFAKHEKIETWHAEQVAYLASKLQGLRDASGSTVLENTIVLWENNMATGLHAKSNIPYVIVGGKNCGVRGGRHLVLNGRPHNDLLAALAQAMGARTETFGDPQFNTAPLALG